MIDLGNQQPGGLIGVILRALGLLGNGGALSQQQAGKAKLSYLLGGGDPDKVVSPERFAALRHGGPSALLSMPASTRGDGSIAAGYKPTSQALREGLIEPGAIDTVRGAEASGIRTVSSGMDRATKQPFAIGVNSSGRVVEVRGRVRKPT